MSISSIIFPLSNIGYGYTVGEQLRIVGIPTVVGVGTTFAHATVTVTETADDEFAGWVFGKLQVLDDFSSKFNDKKRIFTLTENDEPISIESDTGSLIDLDQVLLLLRTTLLVGKLPEVLPEEMCSHYNALSRVLLMLEELSELDLDGVLPILRLALKVVTSPYHLHRAMHKVQHLPD